MRTDHRTHTLKDTQRSCWISLNGQPGLSRCHARDIFEAGARISCENPSAVPNDFMLYFTSDGKVGRHCKVVWRSRDEIGVQFVGREHPGVHQV